MKILVCLLFGFIFISLLFIFCAAELSSRCESNMKYDD